MTKTDALFSEDDLPPSIKPMEESGYRVLARKYRPTTFSEVIGQDMLVRLLRNGLSQNRLGHGFIFTGIRGVGKTTLARLLARILNCLKEQDLASSPSSIDPCGVCASCQSLSEDRHLDVIEIDAASHTGVDDVREIIDATRYRAVSGRYKIFIIDEVHMLSKSAFNALLKTLEEPPAHVKFIFATTEIRRVPATILSRCLRFDLRRIEPATLSPYLADVCGKENVTFDSEALMLIARAGEGSVRDALSLLDQAILMAEKGQGSLHIQTADVQKMLGLADREPFLNLLKTLFSQNAEEALNHVRSLHHAGVDPVVLVEELLHLTHFLSLLKAAPQLSLEETMNADEKKSLQNLAETTSLAHLGRFWQMLLKGAEEISKASFPLQALEMVCLRLIHSNHFPTPEKLLQHFLSEKAPALEGVEAPLPLSQEREKEKTSPSPQPLFNSFEELLTFVASKREAMLHLQLKQDVHLVQFKWGEIRLRLASTAPSDLPQRLKTFLTTETKVPWVIQTTLEEGEPTWEQQQSHQKDLLSQKISGEPLIQKAQTLFPGMTFNHLEPAST